MIERMKANAISFNIGSEYALLNYKEIIEYYKLPFYKKIFKKAPIKELTGIKTK